MAALRQKETDFAGLGVKVVNVVCMDKVRTRFFATSKPGTQLALTDCSRRVAALYGVAKQLVVRDQWVNAPSTFVIKDGVIAWKYVGKGPADRPPMDKILEAVKTAK